MDEGKLLSKNDDQLNTNIGRRQRILLTTSVNDSADILGDRIAIMAEGQLRCLGSSLFLKKTYGVGYQLTIEKKPLPAYKAIADVASEKEDASSFIDQRMENIVLGNVEAANLLTNVGTEMSFQLPLGAASTFAPMFDQLEELVAKDEIVTYGVGITTLDEVFLLVARGALPEKARLKSTKAEEEKSSTIVDNDRSVSSMSKMDLETEALFSRHVSALFRKRALNFKRDRKAWCCTTILPSVFVLLGFLLFAFVTPTRNLDAIVMDLNDYNEGVTSPQNPIAFNTDDRYSCQPGKCIYEIPIVASAATDELYYFCGTQSYIGNGTVCSTNEYFDTISQITHAGAEPAGASVMNVNESSYSLSETAYNFAATQYGGIFFQHDLSSTIVNSEDSSSVYDLYSVGSPMDFLDGIDMETVGPMLESMGVDMSGFNITELLTMGFELDFLKDLFPTPNSVVGMNYSEAVVSTCLLQGGNYSSDADCRSYAGIGYLIQYNYTAIHVAPLYQKLADEAIVREATGDDEFKIQTVIHPLPITSSEESIGNADDAFTAWFLIILSFPFISGSFATFVVQEKQSKAKHLQTVAGVKPVAYWLSTWLWDIANYQIPCWITVMLMYAFDVSTLTATENGVAGGVITLLVLFGPAIASFSYCVSFMFSSPSICNLILIISGFLIGFGGTLAAFILRILGVASGIPNENLINAATIVEWVLRFFPAFNLARGLYSAINIETISLLAGKRVTVWAPEACLWEVVFLAWQSVVYLLLAMKLDEWSANPRAVTIFRKIFCCDWRSSFNAGVAQRTNIDDDVAAEENRVLTGGANDDLIVLSQLGKVFGNGKKAVDSMSLGIPPGQCFGLLGINGAGKTTTMGMLTAEFPPSSGDATLAGHSVANEPEKTRRRVGYCPQFDAHFTNLTGREHVELYASIKGIPVSFVKEAAASKLAEVGLSEFDSDRLAAGYSGGMKRRLSLATATIGNPQIVFLDECSTGVDPVARREIWEMISNMVSDKNVPPAERTSVILTTHSMEECEALCPRIAIMAGGNLKCIGSAQQLKSKFGQGYQVELKIKNVETTDEDYVDILTKLAKIADVSEEDAIERGDEIFLDLEKTKQALNEVSVDGYLTELVSEKYPNGQGYLVWKEAKSPTGIDLDEIAEFASGELRMRILYEFMNTTYPNSVLRERQDSKTRYEVSSKGVRIGDIFAAIEENKVRLMVAEYGVSQTSLEQVFNMHAAEAEKSKRGTTDS
jgi:ABC-type multidrug transport system ATPase subunit